MNERIKLLAIEARLIAPEYSDCTHTTLSPQEQKFAELIVRECALTAGLMEHEGRPDIGAQILDNFGVES
jgi:hypothetical protein